MTVWRLRVDDASTGLHDIVVDARADSQASDLGRALADAGFRGGDPSVGGSSLGHGRTLADLQLTHGDTVSVGKRAADPPLRSPGTYLVVAAGFDAGSSVRLEATKTLVGRAPEAQLRLQDGLVGRRHLTVRRDADGSALLTDLGSGNGTLVEGEPISGTVTVTPGQLAQCGATLLTVERVPEADLPSLADVDDAARPFARRFREALPPLPDRLQAPSPPADEDPPSRPSWWRPLLPLLSGLGLVVMTGRPQFLVVMAIGPIVLLFEAQRHKKAEKRREERKSAKTVKEMAEHTVRVASVLAAEQRRRRQQSPAVGVSVVHGILRTRQLWARSPEDEDFGAVTLGFATLPSAVKIEGGDAHAPTPTLWQVPVSVSLPRTGSIAVLGAPNRSQAVARGLILSLCVNHPPNDLRLWVLSDAPRSSGWAFARWLPHTFLEGGGARLAASEDERSVLLNALNQVLETRLDQAAKHSSDELHLPLDVVVLDWPGSATSDDVATLLSKGARCGIVGIAVEAEKVIEGVKGTLRLSQHSDEASFESRFQPKVDGVVVAEVSPDTAGRTARNISGLRSAVGEASTDQADLRLVDLLGLTDLSGSSVLQRWHQRSPASGAIIGRASGTPMTIDVVRDGPHGLVGGTTRSGKTKFLKTLLASLVLDNAPDDLSILIVDFKGGVDHAAFGDLPHVVSLSTNADADRFARTIALLVAEQNRRQELFRSCGAANLDAYRGVRKHRADLPPVPRLLVVVDEFGEFLSTEMGKEHLKTLESVTRIGGGLGLHLLLSTQTFESQLPAQVAANTGMRVCFRVQAPSDSKIVLESGASASIPRARPGRAYARFHRGDLIEFQSARVAGRRKELSTGPPPVRVLLAPIGSLAGFSANVEREEVPVEESDLGAILHGVRAAAAQAGWKGSAIPWPGELPSQVSYASLLATPPDRAGTPIGVADVPERQAREVTRIDPGDEQVLLVGGSKSGIGEALLGMVAAASVRTGPDALHVYAIDLTDGSLASLSALPGVGAVAVRNDGLALKIVRRLLDVTAERRSLFASYGVSSVADLATHGVNLPRVLLAVHGAERLLAKEENAATPLTPALLRLLAESSGTGVELWLTGTSALGYHRLGTGIARRLVLQIPDSHEYQNLGVPRAMAIELDRPGRAYDVNAGRLTQLASVSNDPLVPAAEVVRALGARLHDVHASVDVTRWPPRVVEVAWPLPFERLNRAALRPPSGYSAPFAVGIDTARGSWAWLDALEDGPVIAVAGGGRSGRSSCLLAIGEIAAAVGWRTLALASSRRSPLWRADAPFDKVGAVDSSHPADLETISRPTLIVVDDAHRLEMDDLGLKAALEGPHPVAVVVAGAVDFVSRRAGFLRSLPKIRTAVVLAPTNSSDGSGFGLSRVPDTALTESRPGRGLLVVNGEWQEIQFPFRQQ